MKMTLMEFVNFTQEGPKTTTELMEASGLDQERLFELMDRLERMGFVRELKRGPTGVVA